MTNDLNIFNATAADFGHSCVDHRHCGIGQCRAVPVEEDQERIRRSHRFGRQGILNTRERGKEVVAARSGFSRLIGFGPVTNIGLFLNPAVVVCLRGSSILSCHVAAAIGKAWRRSSRPFSISDRSAAGTVPGGWPVSSFGVHGSTVSPAAALWAFHAKASELV